MPLFSKKPSFTHSINICLSTNKCQDVAKISVKVGNELRFTYPTSPSVFCRDNRFPVEITGGERYSNVEVVWNHEISTLLHIIALPKLVEDLICL